MARMVSDAMLEVGLALAIVRRGRVDIRYDIDTDTGLPQALVGVKLTAYREKDRLHLRDLLEVGLIDD